MRRIKIKVGSNKFMQTQEKDLDFIHGFYFITNDTIYLSTHEFLTISVLIHEIVHKILYDVLKGNEPAFLITSKWDNIDDPFNGLYILNYPSNPNALIYDE